MLVCLGYFCYHNTIWYLQVPIASFRAWLELGNPRGRDWVHCSSNHLTLILMCLTLPVWEQKCGNNKGEKSRRVRRAGNREEGCRKNTWLCTLKCMHGTHTYTCSERFPNMHPSACFSELQVQCPAAALPCMPAAWIISPSQRRSHQSIWRA